MPYVFRLRVHRYLHRSARLLDRAHGAASRLSYRALERAVRRMLVEQRHRRSSASGTVLL